MKYVKDRIWLFEHLKEVRLVDCRFSLADPQKGRKEYEENHLPGAVYFDLEKDLSSRVQTHGGRHPLPDLQEFVGKLDTVGINENTTVIAYDNGEGAYASRFWWMLQYLGHEQVYVLDRGYKGWVEAGYPLTTEIPFFQESHFHIKINQSMLAEMNDVKKVVEGVDSSLLIDSREERRYLGIEEPIDKKAGHIPGAINKPWIEGLASGKFKTLEEQKERFSNIRPQDEIIVYCGSGVTAAPNVLTLKEAGFNKVRLYIGSFSDWISYDDNKID